jgi:PAS domain S-box-containing protein
LFAPSDVPSVKHLLNQIVTEKYTLSHITAIVAGLVYLFVGRIALITSHGFASMIWPPSGIALAMLILLGVRYWPIVWLAALATNLTVGGPLVSSLGAACGNTLEAYLGARILLATQNFRPALDDLRVVFRLIIPVALVTTAIAALIGVSSYWLTGAVSSDQWLKTFGTWWLGDALGVLIIAPFILISYSIPKLRFSRLKIIEAIFLFCCVFLISFFIYDEPGSGIGQHFPVSYLIFPLIFWSALQFGQPGAVFSCFTVALVSAWDFHHGKAFVALREPSDTLFYTQALEGILAASGMIFAAIVTERKEMGDDLEIRVRQRTHDLAKSEERFRLVVAGVKDFAIFMLDPLGNIVSWNEGARRTEGYEANEIIGKHFSVFYTPEDIDREKPAWEIREATEHGRIEDEGFRVRKDGTRFWANVVLTAIYDDLGRHVGFSKVTRDLTERKRNADLVLAARDELEIRVNERTKELAASRDQLSIILRGITDGIVVINEFGQIIFSNQAVVSICGFDSSEDFAKINLEELRGLLDFRDEAGERLAIEDFPFSRALNGEEAPEIVMRIRKRNTQEERWIISKASPVIDQTKRIGLVVIILKDFTERKNVEDQVKYLEEASRVLSSSLDYENTLTKLASLAITGFADWCLIDVWGPDGESLRPLAVRNRRSSLVKLAGELRAVASDAGIWAWMTEVAKTGRAIKFDKIDAAVFSYPDLNPEYRAIVKELDFKSAIVVPLRSRGRILGAISLLSSETTRRFSQSDLFVAEELGRRAGIAFDNALLYEETQKAVQIRDEFLSVASHELKTPMTSLLLQSQVRKRWLNKYGPEHFDKTRLTTMLAADERQIARLTRLIDEMLDISRLRAGRLNLNFEKLSMNQVVSDVLTHFGAELQASGNEIRLDADQEVVGEWDRTRLEQLFTNLLTNAMKYGKQKPIEVRLENQIRDGAYFAQLSVRDHGIGIAPEDQKRIFRQFERAENVHTISGLGLGLYITKQIVEAHGGTIAVTSEPGEGSTFTVELPLVAKRQDLG